MAYEQVVQPVRASRQALCAIEKEAPSDRMSLIVSYKKKLEAKLVGMCNDILEMIENKLIPDSDPDGKIFYLKLLDDYSRNLAEFQSSDSSNKSVVN